MKTVKNSGDGAAGPCWTRPSVPVCGDTSKGNLDDWDRCRLGHRPVVLFAIIHSQAYVRARLSPPAPPGSSVAVRDRGHLKGVFGKRRGPLLVRPGL